MSCVGGDCTEQYTKGANEALRLAKENDVALCIMKEKTAPPAEAPTYMTVPSQIRLSRDRGLR